MTSDREKLLAQGPRTAPEPVTADGFEASVPAEATSFEPPADEPSTTESKPPLLKSPPQGSWSGTSGSWLTGSLLRRLIPLVLVLVVVGRGFAGGHSGSWAFALIWIVAAVVILVLRMRGRRPW